MWPKFSFKFVPDDSVRDLLTNLPIGCCSVKPFKREIDNIWPRDAQKEGTFPPSIKHTHSNVIRAALFVSKNVNPRPLKLRVWRIRLLDLTESLANQMNSTRQSNRTMERLFNELLTSVLCHTQKSWLSCWRIAMTSGGGVAGARKKMDYLTTGNPSKSESNRICLLVAYTDLWRHSSNWFHSKVIKIFENFKFNYKTCCYNLRKMVHIK